MNDNSAMTRSTGGALDVAPSAGMMPVGTASMERANRLYPTTEEWNSILLAAKVIWDSEIAKNMTIPNQGAIVTVALKGWELGVPLIAALEGINMIKGRPRPNGPFLEFLGARVGGWVEWVKDGRDGTAECIAHRRGKKAVRGIFSIDDAKRAGLMGKETYQQYPADMIRRRALSRATWMQFSDLYFGFVPPSNEVVDAGFEDDDEAVVVVDNDGAGGDASPAGAPPTQAATAESKPKRGRPPGPAAQAAPPAASAAAQPSAAPAGAPGGATAAAAPPASMTAPESAPPSLGIRFLSATPPSPPVDQAPIDDFMDAAPEDKVLPFVKGPYMDKKLSELEKSQFEALITGYRTSVGNANIAEDRKVAHREWLARVEAWAKYRGIEVPA